MNTKSVQFIREYGSYLQGMLFSLLGQMHQRGYISPFYEVEMADMPETRGDSKVGEDTYSLTTQLVNALLACGYRNGGAYLDKVLRWFLSRSGDQNRVPLQPLDKAGLYLLESLMLLRPTAADLQRHDLPPDFLAFLAHTLKGQRFSHIHYQVEGSVAPQFAALWATRLFLQAERERLLDDPAFHRQLQDDITRFLGDVSARKTTLPDQDLALALNLRYQLRGSLTPRQQQLLSGLLDLGRANGGLWNARSSQITNFREFVKEGLRVDAIKANRIRWRETFVGTLYVIENLAALRREYPEITPVLDESMALLGQAFFRQPDLIQQSFADKKDKTSLVLIMARLLVAVQQYSAGYFQEYLLTALMDGIEVPRGNGNPEHNREGVEQSLRHWFEVSFDPDPQQLTMGLSGAKVLRIRPRITIPPAVPTDMPQVIQLQGFDSVIVKYGPHDELRTEFNNYQEIPDRIKKLFAKMQLTHADNDNTYLIIQDLQGYLSLEECLTDPEKDFPPHFMDDLLAFLRSFNETQLRIDSPKPYDLLHELYWKSAWRYADTVFSLFNHVAVQEHLRERGYDRVSEKRDMARHTMEKLTEFYHHTDDSPLAHFPLTYMHGDLHTRNIMIHAPQDQSRVGGDFRLIDVEKFMVSGDCACDIGQLSVNLIWLISQSKVRRHKQFIAQMENQIKSTYMQIAEQIDDQYFEIRLALAECRARLRIAHGIAKDGRGQLRAGHVSDAASKALAALDLAELAHHDLEYMQILMSNYDLL